MLFLYCVCHAFASADCCHVVSCWERADLLSLVFFVLNCVFVTFLFGILGLVWYLIVLITDLCRFSYFHTVCIVLHISAVLVQ